MNDIERSLHYLVLGHSYALSVAKTNSELPRKSKHTPYAGVLQILFLSFQVKADLFTHREGLAVWLYLTGGKLGYQGHLYGL